VRTKVTLVLIFLNVALFFFIFRFERDWRTEAASLEARRRVLGQEAANIRALEINRATGDSVSLVRDRDHWALSRPLDWPANPHAVSSILHELQLLEHETSFRVADLAKTSQSLADYGLDEPGITVTFSSGDTAAGAGPTPPPTVLRIGDLTKDGRRLYILSPDGERIHVVGRALIDTLSLPLEQLRADSLLTIPVFEARSLIVQTLGPEQNRGGGATGIRTRVRRDGTRWTFDTPIIARASKTAVDLAINDLNALQPRTFNPTNTGTLPSVRSEMRITLEGNNRHETLFLGDRLGPAAGTSPASSSFEYLAQLEGRNALFTVIVPTRLIDSLRNAQETLREKRLLDFEARAVSAITLSSPLLSGATLTLRRLDDTAGATSDATSTWQIVQREDGTQAPQPIAADQPAVQRLLESLAQLRAEQFTSDAPTSADLEAWGFNRPEREIRLTFAGGTTPTLLSLGTDSATPRNVYARVGTLGEPGTSVYRVRLDLGRELPIDVGQWRNRNLREPLPAGARFAALKLTDYQSGEVIYQSAFNPAGEPVNPPGAPTAVVALLEQMRLLRAKAILRSGFTDQINLAGDERPWRYELEASFTVPGAGTGEVASRTTLYLSDRLGGSQQYAGSRELDLIFEIEQPLIDALWALTSPEARRTPAGQTKE